MKQVNSKTTNYNYNDKPVNLITTIEGESKNLQLLQESWVELNVAQCGFCQPGQLIAATALLDKNDNPTDDDINEAMIGNICRCGTYQRIRSAIHKTAELTNSKTE